MKRQTAIALEQLGENLNIDIEIVRDFGDFGLFPVILVEGKFCIDIRYLDRAERALSLYRTLGINKEGIDIILELREEISSLQEQIEVLRAETDKMKARLSSDDPEVLKTLGLLIEIDD